jgi:hypothetical protein
MTNARKRKRRNSHRRLAAQQLETRCLLAAPEGGVFSLPTQTFETIGFVGSLSSTIDWGDGTQTQLSLGNQSAPNTLRFRFDYSRDSNNFFTSARRAVLADVGRSILQHFTDQLSPINPGGVNTWTATLCHPSQGRSNFLCDPNTLVNVSNMQVAANEIVIFAGARDYIGNIRGTGSVGGFAGSGQQDFLNTVASRGQSGALANPQTDFGPWGGSISFDTSGTSWFFGADIKDIQPDQVDFRTVAAHELIHVLGFGFGPTDRTSSWERLSPGSTFNGNAARSAYIGSGFPPVDTSGGGDGPAKSHWAHEIENAGQLTLMRGEVNVGERQMVTRLDLAALDDIGWQISYPNTISIANKSHVYGDDADYDVEITLRGSTTGDLTRMVTANITNVAPTLTVPSTQTIVVGDTLTLPQSAFGISDPGFGTSGTKPPTTETFTYSIDWKDGSALTTGAATITQQGNSARDTLAAFAASHTYTTEGNYQVAVTVSDDDGGIDTENFTVQVIPPPSLSLSLSQSSVAENDGPNAAVLTVTRSGPTKNVNETITLASSDTTEATLPASVVILAGESSATAQVEAKDDQLLDGAKTVTLSASGNSVASGEITLNVTDFETLTAAVTAAEILENEPNSVSLSVTRSNTDTGQSLEVMVSGGNAIELTMPDTLIIDGNTQVVTVGLQPVDDADPELPLRLMYTFTAPGYQGGTVEFDLLDDEPPLFQNQANRFDVNLLNGVTSLDALLIINQLIILDGVSGALDPETQQPDGVFLDVNGDYKVSALDALQVINERVRQFESEFIGPTTNQALPNDPLAGTLDEDEDDLLVLALDPGRIF